MQAYTLELEAEVAKLKEMNRDLQRKQVYIIGVKLRILLKHAEIMEANEFL